MCIPQPEPPDPDKVRLDEIRARRAATTKGNWRYIDYGRQVITDAAIAGILPVSICLINRAHKDGDFIAAAPADLDYLLTRVTQLESDVIALDAKDATVCAELNAALKEIERLEAQLTGNGYENPKESDHE